ALLLDLIHVFPGGKEIHRPMVSSELVAPLKAVWSVVWHGVTVVLAFGGIALITAAFFPEQALALAALPIAVFLGFAGLFIAYGILRLGTIWTLPQWTAFLVIAGLGLVGIAP
ncbi:MAG: hypothetical protein ACKO2N_24015, partial [Tabrizicola sp.]